MGDDFFSRRKLYFGDIHNHCGVSYGHGPLPDALRNAALQLDFASITGHAAWPDMDEGVMPPEVVDYHLEGFRKFKENRAMYAEALERANVPGSFVTIGGYELHSFRYGDYTVLQKDTGAPMILPEDGDAMLRHLRNTVAERDGIILMPHHIGYKTGFRGMDWNAYNPEASPLVEIVSMHGCAETENRAFPYLHTMGPLDDANTVQAGLARGFMFGVTGSTDHHSAHPGSYGYGKTAVWATGLTREAVWQAFLERRTYAVTGDRIHCAFSVNGEPMGGMARESAGDRIIRFEVRGGDALSRLEIIKNNRVWYQKNYIPSGSAYGAGSVSGNLPGTSLRGKLLRGKVYFEMGWGEKGVLHEWDVQVRLDRLAIESFEPQFRGIDVVDPLDRTGERFSFTSVPERTKSSVHVRTVTFGNATSVTSQTQGFCLELAGTADGIVELVMDGAVHKIPLRDLVESGKVFYLAGFLSSALKVHRFVPEGDYTDDITLTDPEKKPGDVYYGRLVQQNLQSAWTSPVRVG
jgi:hypothetical protein